MTEPTTNDTAQSGDQMQDEAPAAIATAHVGGKADTAPVDDTLVDDTLIEEISIDGMCGVY